MASFRRSLSVTQRDGALQNGDVSFDMNSPPKLPHSRTYLIIGRLLNTLSSLLDISGVSLPRVNWRVERPKGKGLHMKHSLSHYFICFMVGIFVSFTPFLPADVTKQQIFRVKEDSVAEKFQRRLGSIEKEIQYIEKPLSVDSDSFRKIEERKVKSEVLDTLDDTPISYVRSPSQHEQLVPQKLLIIVTPTYERQFQAYYLNRLAHTLKVVSLPLIWIVIEMPSQSTETAKILRETGIMYRHLVCNHNVTSIRNREVHQRNIALSYIEKHQLDGIVHFADDDRLYSVDLFEQMRQIRHFGTWPVAMLSESKNKVLLEGPVCNGSRVTGWITNQRSKLFRRFHVDMSGFAFNSTVLWDSKRWRHPNIHPIRLDDKAKEGFQETTFIEQLVEDESQMEGVSGGCLKTMIWHLHLETPELLYPKGWLIPKNLEFITPLTSI